VGDKRYGVGEAPHGGVRNSNGFGTLENKLVVEEVSDFARCIPDRKRNEESRVDARFMGVVYHEPFEDEHMLGRRGVVEAVIDDG